MSATPLLCPACAQPTSIGKPVCDECVGLFAEARRILGWVHHRTRSGCFSRKRSQRDQALADVNFWTQKFSGCWQSSRGPQDPNAQWFGETP